MINYYPLYLPLVRGDLVSRWINLRLVVSSGTGSIEPAAASMSPVNRV